MPTITDVDAKLREIPGLEDTSFVEKLLPQVIDVVRVSRRLPVGEEFAIRKSSKDFAQSSRDLGARTLSTTHQLLKFLDPAVHGEGKPRDLENYGTFIDNVDSILERVDSLLKDAVSNAGSSGSNAISGNSRSASSSGGGPPLKGSVLKAEEEAVANLAMSFAGRGPPKPQARWRRLVENHRVQFVPRLLEKHHAQVPLQPEIEEAQRAIGLRAAPHKSKKSKKAAAAVPVGPSGPLPHPYAAELEDHCWGVEGFSPVEPQFYGRVEDTPLVLVNTVEQLREMIDEIKSTCAGKEIAVDVEHHDYRSYKGFVCLVQISTRTKDFIVDPFDIFEQMHMLNEIFADPSIVKVLHGADKDVIWLQRDFSVYLVNMFDTGQATRELKFPGGFGLANLVSTFCSEKLDKQYQTADWRQRPLPDEMVKYARFDTHFLLYCYDRLRNALLTTGTNQVSKNGEASDLEATKEGVDALQTVLMKSTELARQLYTEEPFDDLEAARKVCDRFGSKRRPLEDKNFGVLKAVLRWRDTLAREIDESFNFLAPDAAVWRIALALPTSTAKLRQSCNPLPAPLLQYAQEVVDVVSRQLEAPDKPASPDADGAATATTAATAATTGKLTTGASSTSLGFARSRSFLSENSASPTGAGGPVTSLTIPDLPVWKEDWPKPRKAAKPVVHITVASTAAAAAQLPHKATSLLSTMSCRTDESEESSLEPEANPKQKLKDIESSISFKASAPEAPPNVAIKEAAPVKPQKPSKALRDALGVQDSAGDVPEDELNLPKVKRKRKRAVANLETLVKAPVQAAPDVVDIIEDSPVAAAAPAATAAKTTKAAKAKAKGTTTTTTTTTTNAAAAAAPTPTPAPAADAAVPPKKKK
eukprot:CAMPEP_0206438304 /NCGR_PEP_ID=MMETSP0324_2-20121206/11554_1 /ASSEMBLY_ACC=CAM_ASM_000836 /TAXON_ID=2866 /ORGANISM="Crypthecodinium cohnii, Strain Seligo" /LENGTH=869 /DNA_ID=CAMNT_0053905745 /DNA_START=57 /DNA_END=2663 /DNA_ORIENTATION=+